MLVIDESRKHAISAGQCDKCGNFKTWDFKVLNQKSGKMMPGHVTRDGYKINNGDCPYYAMVASRKPREANAQATAAPAAPSKPAGRVPTPEMSRDDRGTAPAARAPHGATVEPGKNGTVVLRAPTGSVTLDRDGALLACAAILSLLARRE